MLKIGYLGIVVQLQLQQRVFLSFQNNPKILDPSDEMDLEFWDSCRRGRPAEFHKNDLDIWSHSRKGKTPF